VYRRQAYVATLYEVVIVSDAQLVYYVAVHAVDHDDALGTLYDL
jgi:hypothetical protein